MKSKLKHNFGLKLIAVLFAIILWMISVDINDPEERKFFTGVKVQLLNASSITGQGKTYKVLNGTDTVRITVMAKNSVLSQITEDDITVRADLSELTEFNTVPIEYVVDSTVANRIQSVSLDKENLFLEIEEVKKKQMRIEVLENGTLPDGYVTGKVSTETNTMSISGPESKVAPVARAVVEINLDSATSDIDMVASIRLLDEEGKELGSSDIKKSIDSVKVNVPVLPTKEVPVVFDTSGTPMEGYVNTGNITVSQASVRIAGRESALRDVTEIRIPTTEVDITDATENVVKNVDIKKFLPSNISLADKTASGIISVTVEILPIRHRVIAFNGSNIQLLNNPNPQRWLVEAVADQQLRLELAGLQQHLEGVDLSVVVPHIDLNALLDAEGNFPEGEMETEILFLIPEDVTQEGAVTARLRITKLEAEE